MPPLNPELDLELTRLMRATPAQIWRCWTDPALFALWWAPRPVVTRDVVIDLRPGGRFRTVMALPDGSEHASDFCILDAEPERRIEFTDMMEAGFRPSAKEMFGFTGQFTFVADGGGTRYTARAMHRTAEVRQTHAEMGFYDGWGTVATQLEELAQGL